MSGINAGISPVAVPVSASWSTTWTMTGNVDLGQHTITGPLAITSSATGAVAGGTTCAVLVADGTNVPTVDGLTVSPFSSGSGEKTLLVLIRVGGQTMWFSSIPVSVAAPTGPTNLRIANLVQITESGDATAGWSYALAPSGTWSARGGSHALGATGDFIFQATIVGSGDVMVGCGSNATGPGAYIDTGHYNLFNSGGYGSAYSVIENGGVGTIDTATNRASGDIIRVQRVGSTLTFAVARTATPTTFTTINTITGITATQYAFIGANSSVTINETKGQGFA